MRRRTVRQGGGWRAARSGYIRFIPPGHYPPPGECRIWYSDRPPGHQPPPQPCDSLYGRVPLGSFLLFDREAWDTRYDWPEYERRNPDSVPGVVLRIMSELARG